LEGLELLLKLRPLQRHLSRVLVQGSRPARRRLTRRRHRRALLLQLGRPSRRLGVHRAPVPLQLVPGDGLQFALLLRQPCGFPLSPPANGGSLAKQRGLIGARARLQRPTAASGLGLP
jgi:hypothetical protein